MEKGGEGKERNGGEGKGRDGQPSPNIELAMGLRDL